MLYASCEPCPMCLASAYWARVSRVVYANTRDEAAATGFDDRSSTTRCRRRRTGASCRCEHTPVEEARAVFAEWMKKADRIAY